MKKSILIHSRAWLLLALCVVGLVHDVMASERVRATPREARAMFDKAVAYLETNGPERAFAAFNDRKGTFVHKDLYVFVLDLKGVYHASGAAPEALVSYVRRVGDYVVGVGYSAPRATADTARAMLDEAVALVRQEGIEKAVSVFNDRHGRFVRDDLYVFAVGLESGKFEAMGMKPVMVGTDALSLKDAAGHALIAEMVEKTRTADDATVDYVWLNPVTNAVEHKRSYVRRVGGSLIGVGHYLEK